ncbi:hypothetical protein Tco_0482505 [Tanacetum coccineum]
MSLHQALDLILELDQKTIRCTRDILRQRDGVDRFSEVPWVVPTFAVIKGESKSLKRAHASEREILLDVVRTSGYRCELLQSFLAERIKQGNE